MRNNVKFTGLILLLLTATVAAAAPPQGEWSCVALTPNLLALTGDYSTLQRRLFLERMDERKRTMRKNLPGWAKDFRFHISGWCMERLLFCIF